MANDESREGAPVASGKIVCVLVHRQSSFGDENPELVAEALKRIQAVFRDVPVYSNRMVSASVAEGREINLVSGNLTACARKALEAQGTDAQDSIAILREWHPLLDAEPLAEALASHARYLAHYTYSENLPPGLVPDFASLEFLRLLGDKEPDDLRAFAYKNINDYDVELYYRLPDLRQYRLDLTCASSRSRRLATDMLERGATFAKLEGMLQEAPELLRPLPSYFEIELTTRSSIRPVFAPRPGGDSDSAESEDLEASLVHKLLNELEAHGLEQDATIALGGRGEPLEHPEIASLLKSCLASNRVARVYLETWGPGLDGDFLDGIASAPGIEKLHIIFRLTTLKPERYEELYGADRLPEVLGNLEALERRSESERPFSVYAEMLKIKDVEDEITAYFDRFEESPVQVILQKFNSYIGRVPERRVSDLTPLHREFCWHLARDFFLTAGGRVPLCKQDPFAEKQAADFRAASLLDIRAQTMDAHIASVRGEHERIPMPCLQCDEWYTFNG